MADSQHPPQPAGPQRPPPHTPGPPQPPPLSQPVSHGGQTGPVQAGAPVPPGGPAYPGAPGPWVQQPQPPLSAKTSGFAIAGFVLGLVGAVVLAPIFSIIALRKIQRN